jgi:tetratricopeptide (TPR) repeat protein
MSHFKARPTSSSAVRCRAASPWLGLLALVMLPLAAAAEEKCVSGADVDREERPSLMGERTYRRISSVHEQLGEENYDDARKTLESMRSGNLNDYELAIVEQTLGYVFTGQGNYAKAVPHFEKAIELDSLPNSAHFGLMYSLAQLYAGMEPPRFKESVDLTLEYIKFQCDPKPEAFILVASGYASMERYREALPYVQKAIAGAGGEAKESWYQLELAIYFELKDYKSAASLLTRMVGTWPDKLKYWEMLSGAYQEQGRDTDSLSVLMVAYQKGLITEEKKILNVVNMNMFLDVPYIAGSMLEKEMAAGRVETTEKNLEKLRSAWTSAREFDKAVAVIDQLAPMKPDGELYVQKAQLLMEKGQWEGVITASEQALEKGGLDKPGGAYLMMGIAANELERWDKAREALNEARRVGNDSTRRQASDWLTFVEDRRQVAMARN